MRGAFDNCSMLTSVSIGNSVTSIGDYAFYGCSGLTSVTIGNGVTSIGSHAFYGCSGLTSITIPDSVTSIGGAAFSGCSGLTEIYYTGDVASWCGISGLDEVMSSGRTLYIGGEEVEGDLVIPNGVTSISNYAFDGCTDLTSVTIPDSVTSIGNNAFRDCSSLTSVTFENTTGWYLHSSSTATSGTLLSSSSLSNPSTAAEWLRSTFYNYYWKRKV